MLGCIALINEEIDIFLAKELWVIYGGTVFKEVARHAIPLCVGCTYRLPSTKECVERGKEESCSSKES